MTADTPAGGPSSQTLSLSAGQVPPGFWQRDLEHWRLPVTPMTADLRIGKYRFLGQKLAAEEFAALTPSGVVAVIDGYVYRRSASDHGAPSAERIAAYEEKVRSEHYRVVLRRWREQVRPSIVQQLQRFRDRDLAILTDGELMEHFRALDACLLDWYVAHYCNNEVRRFALGRCMAFCRERLDLRSEDFLGLLAGASTASSGPVTAMEEMAGEVRKDPSLMQALASADAWSHPLIRELLRPYLDTYGYRALELEYAVPTLEEQPQRVVRLLREAVARLDAGEEGAAEKVRNRRDARVDGLRQKLPDDTTRAEFDLLLADAQAAYGARDDEKGLLASADGLMRYVLLEAGRRLARHGHLTGAERVFALWCSELEESMAGQAPGDLSQRAEARWREHLRHRTLQPPISYGTRPAPAARPSLSQDVREAIEDTEITFDPPRRGDAPSDVPSKEHRGEVRGRGASAGRRTGQARVVLTEAELDRVRPGDVLVCPVTTPAWAVVFGKISALVTDTGGVLSHPAITAREFGIPAVVATGTATKTLRDGQTVHVDGTAGVVRF